MLGLGWTEMMVVGVLALIVIGPKDLPVVMNRIGKVAGQIRRMGTEFQREINRSTGLDEVRNLRSSITAPLKKTSDDIRKEFNAMTPSGAKPSGVIKPADPDAESVVDEIKAKAGMTEPAKPKTADEIAREAGFKPAGPAPTKSSATFGKPAGESEASEADAPEDKPEAARKAPAKARTTKATAASGDAAPAAAKKPAARKQGATTKAAASARKPAASKAAATAPETDTAPKAAPAKKPAPRKRAPAKPKTTTAAKAGDE